MFMLYLVLGATALWLFWAAVTALNAWGEKQTGHTFFTGGTITTASIGYWMLFFGYHWYEKEKTRRADAVQYCYDAVSGNFSSCLETAGNSADPLNGIVLMLLGAAVLVLLFFYQVNAARKDQDDALLMTLFFFMLCLPMSAGLFLIVLVLIAWFSETKPVYTVNHFIDDD